MIAPSAIRARGTIFTDRDGLVQMEEPRALERSEINDVIGEYVAAALAARRVGFDGVELHFASGYLPMQFLSPNANLRTDDYGGSVENRCRFAVELLEAVAGAVGAGRTGFRICPGFAFNDVEDDDPAATYGWLLRAASPLALAYLHLITVRTAELDPLAIIKANWKGSLILNNDLDGTAAADAVRSGTADAVSFGRAFIANPDLPLRLRANAPLTDYDPTRLYTPGPQGYTDYLSLKG